jgi:hypothetical protein
MTIHAKRTSILGPLDLDVDVYIYRTHRCTLGKEDVLDRLVVSLFQLAIAIEIEKLVNPILMIVNSC